MKSSARAQNISQARNVAMYVMKKVIANITLKEIGVYFNKDHATVIHSVKRIEDTIEKDQLFKNTVNNIIREVREKN